LLRECIGAQKDHPSADTKSVMEAEHPASSYAPRITTQRDRTRAEILVYLPLRGTVMSLLQANAILREREPYVLMTPGDRQVRRSA
jgi:hypothetical protein